MKLPLTIVNEKRLNIVQLVFHCETHWKRKTLSGGEINATNRIAVLPGLAQGIARLRSINEVDRQSGGESSHRAGTDSGGISTAWKQQQTLMGEYTQEGGSL